MKKTVFLFAIVLVLTVLMSADGFSQRRQITNLPKYDRAKYHFGFTLGVNRMDFTVRTKDDMYAMMFYPDQMPDLNLDSAELLAVNSNPVSGFVIGIVGDLRLGKYFNLRFLPALIFGERTMNYSILGYKNEGENILDVQKRVSSTFVDLPLLIKYKSKRVNNYRAYVLLGGQYSIDLASTASKKDEHKDVHVKLQRSDIYLTTGVGFDFYNPWFKFGVELRMNYGIRDVLLTEETIYTDGIERLNSKIFQLIFTFE